MTDTKYFDVIIIGGSYAGLSAAMALGRSLRKVLIIDSGLPCNRQTPHSHNFVTQDGEKPAVISGKAKAQVLSYPSVQFLNDVAAGGKKWQNGFVISTLNSGEFKTSKLVFATGLKDVMPDIKGFSACWGISIIHCPYCHGYEFRDKKTGIFTNGDKAFHLASLVRNLTPDVTILTSGNPEFTTEQHTKLDRNNIKIIETQVSEIEHDNGNIKNVVFNNGNKMVFDAVYAALPFIQNSDIPVALGCELTEQGFIKVDHFQKTTIEGVFACGDNVNMMRSIANAVYSGNITGAIINKELVDGEF